MIIKLYFSEMNNFTVPIHIYMSSLVEILVLSIMMSSELEAS